MPSYTDLLNQIEGLKKQAAEQRKKEISAVVADIKKKMVEFGITAADLGLSEKTRAGRKVARKGVSKAKYKNPATGQTWSGVGRKPKWITEALKLGKKLEHFLAE